MTTVLDVLKKTAKILDCDVLDITVTAGAALHMHGLRDKFDDIDVEVPYFVWVELLRQKKYKTHYFEDALVVEMPDKVDAHLSSSTKDTVVIDGVRCLSAEELLRFKMWLRDLPDRSNAKRKQDNIDITQLKKLV